MNPVAPTTAEALRAALASTIACSALELHEAVGHVVVATAAECPAAGPEDRSLRDPETRTLVLLADRIPAGQEAQALIEEVDRHHGRQAAQLVLGDRAAELLGSDGEVSSCIEQPDEAIQDVADDVLDRGKKYGFKPNQGTVREAVEESANLLNIDLTEAQIKEACQRVMNPREVSNGMVVASEFTVKIAVACRNAGGSADMPVFDVKVSQDQYDLGEHYDMAEVLAEKGGYEAPFVCFDHTESSVLKSASAVFEGSEVVAGLGGAGVQQGSDPLATNVVYDILERALPAAEGYEKGYKDALQSIALALVKTMKAPALSEAINTALDAYANNAEHELSSQDDSPSP